MILNISLHQDTLQTYKKISLHQDKFKYFS